MFGAFLTRNFSETSRDRLKDTLREHETKPEKLLFSTEERNDKIGTLRMDVTDNSIRFTHEKPKTTPRDSSEKKVRKK